MKIAITGHDGNVGSEILRQRPEIEFIANDITKKVDLQDELDLYSPDIVIHCAALTSVRECEEDDKKAFSVNVHGTRNVAEWCDMHRSCLIYLSTDHVFDGKKYFAYSEKHKPYPINVYGMTKFMGEAVAGFAKRSVIVRTSRLFNYEMVKDDLECLSSGMEIDFTDRIYRSFVHIEHFVEGLLSLVDKISNKEIVITKNDNIINIAGKDRYTYYQFWVLIAREFGIPLEQVKQRTKTLEEMGEDADPRPFRCGLNITKAKRLGIPIYSAHDGIMLMKEKLEE